jgi:protein phosphatase
MDIEHLSSSIVGPVRTNNEDACLVSPENHFFIIADGIGGLNAGEIAAKEATEHFSKEIHHIIASSPLDLDCWIHSLQNSIYKTNSYIYQLSQNNAEIQKMGTTLTSLVFLKEFALFAHVGDSRIYLFREGKLYQLTQDHSIVKKEILQDQKIRYKNLITRAIGISSSVEPDIRAIKVQQNDLFMLCTDGLSNFVPLKEMQKIFRNSLSLNYLHKNLLSTAQFNGSCDNISLITVTIKTLL